MLFDIDLKAYKLVDLSLEVVPNQTTEGRPFEVKEGRLGDGTLKYDIVNTHTHVGTHIESPVHFYFKGKTCTDYPLDHFMGKATLLKTDIEECAPRVTLDFVKRQLEPRRGSFEVLFVRNDTPRNPLIFDMDCVPYFAELGLKLFIFDCTINFGQGLEDGKTFHDLLLSRDCLLVEFPANGQALDRDMFYLFAMPLKIKGIDSSGCRLFAVVER
ncbi:MAG: cyclase family protein [Candidatus Hydrogenedentes bacterium]|nr:cyclase family protein [Candidatus Hydrogenedentota bacterium]MCC6696675.1 cyclase family protein [Candidatus Hydrogenedentota bacterium]